MKRSSDYIVSKEGRKIFTKPNQQKNILSFRRKDEKESQQSPHFSPLAIFIQLLLMKRKIIYRRNEKKMWRAEKKESRKKCWLFLKIRKEKKNLQLQNDKITRWRKFSVWNWEKKKLKLWKHFREIQKRVPEEKVVQLWKEILKKVFKEIRKIRVRRHQMNDLLFPE